MNQHVYRVIARSNVERVRCDVGIAWRFTFALTFAIIGLLLGGGLLWWADKIAAVLAR